jgi:hypothetical protein
LKSSYTIHEPDTKGEKTRKGPYKYDVDDQSVPLKQKIIPDTEAAPKNNPIRN